MRRIPLVEKLGLIALKSKVRAQRSERPARKGHKLFAPALKWNGAENPAPGAEFYGDPKRLVLRPKE